MQTSHISIMYVVLGLPVDFLANVKSCMLSPVRPSVCHLSSVTLVRPTPAVEIFGNISTAFGTLAIR